jgi:hypothetical protein
MTPGGDELYSTDKFEPKSVETLDSGFERLGSKNTPFTLREPPGGPTPELKQRAVAIHNDRPVKMRRRDELRNEQLTLDIETWQENIDEFDFPGVDTIPEAVRQQRADAAAEIAQTLFGIGTINRGVHFEDPAVRGRYFRASGPIEVGTSEDDFPGWQSGVTLAHEVGHGIDDHIEVKTGYASARGEIFENDVQLEEATALSKRLRGPMLESDIPGATDYRKHPTEKAADTFAAMIVEPERARELAPHVTKRFETAFDEFFSRYGERLQELNGAWMNRDE